MSLKKVKKVPIPKKRVRYTPETVLVSWRSVLQALPHMSEEELTECLKIECNEQARKDVIMRLERRLGALITKRIKNEVHETRVQAQES